MAGSRYTGAPARQAAFLAVKRIELENAYSDRVLEELFVETPLIEADRKLVHEIVKGTVRYKLLLDWIASSLLRRDKGIQDAIRWILWISLYQLLYLQRVPRFAVVNDGVELAKRFVHPRFAGVVNGVLRNYLRRPEAVDFPDPHKTPELAVSIRESHPLWLVERWFREFGPEKTVRLCRANNTPPSLTIRRNPLKCDEKSFCEMLDAEHFCWRCTDIPEFYIVDNLVPNKSPLFRQGYFSIQDPGAGLVGHLANPLPGQVLIDLCAAPGGKTTHLAEKLGCRGRIMAGDLYAHRLKRIQQSIERLELSAVYPIQADARSFPAGVVDGVLLDAPCSGLGVMRKKPDIRWHRTEETIDELSRLQAELLSRAAEHVHPGGWLVYSTCTTEVQENEQIIRNFCKVHSDFRTVHPGKLVHEKYVTPDYFIRTWPHLHELDGSFAAKLEKIKP
ncbi:16S rRNA (cytosine(967)-C(5))-methyltransferase RsmB [candidate division KSB1 bacterium]|nr:16S rRNA (cytosine(967)-C(5))-methyltransferase RsmB [candidate division KSB1 bacterium]